MPSLFGAWSTVLTAAGINAIVATGLYFSNSAGAFSAAPAAIAGMGAYVSAVLTTNFGWPFPVAILAGVAAGFLVGAVLALATLRMNELVAGLATIAFGETALVAGLNIDYIGGANGFSGISLLTNFWEVYLALAVLLFFAWRFDGSRLGLAAHASRHNHLAAAAMGINVPAVKIWVFALGSAMAALGGVFRAHYVLVLTPNDMGFWLSVNYVIFWIFGGSYSFAGPAVGALLLTVIPEFLRFSLYDRFILYGGLLVAMVILRPQGLITRLPLGVASRFGKLFTRTDKLPC